MNNKSFEQVMKVIFAFVLAVSLLVPASSTSALPQEAPMLAGSGEPNDPGYDTPGLDDPITPETDLVDQWHFHDTYGINAPDAWAITTGEASTVVAVLDTGIVDHGDLTESGRILSGYDFVDNDSDPRDAADYTGCLEKKWQGTHTAGIIGATTNNSVGVAGIDWNAKLLPVRVIGTCGAVDVADLVEGMRYAAGLTTTPANSNPADVIHVSASIASQACTTAYQTEINAIAATGAIIVAPAGDGNTTMNNFPANCNNVITVAATNSEGVRTSYSNYGSTVEISAPGGGDTHGDVLSTSNRGTDQPELAAGDEYVGRHGTVMAAAHVSGVVSLMFAANPYITRQQVLDILNLTATDFAGGNDCGSVGCGSGIVNAGEAVRIANLPDLVVTNVTLDPADPGPNETFDVNVTVKNQGGSGTNSVVYRNIYVDRDPLTLPRDAEGCFQKWNEDSEEWEPDPGDHFTQQYMATMPPGTETTVAVTISGGLASKNYKLYAYTDANCITAEGFEANNHYQQYVPVSIGSVPGEFSKTTPLNDLVTLQDATVTLEWGATPGADSYEYCYDTTNDRVCQNDEWVDVDTDTSAEITGLLSSTVYYWQVRAKNINGYQYANDVDPDDEIIDGWWAFKTKPYPNLISPANKSLVTTTIPTLQLNSMEGASKYWYEISLTSDFGTKRVDVSSTSSKYTLTSAQALPYGIYYWRARAQYPDSSFSDWSTVNQFGVTFQLKPVQYLYSTIVKPTFTWRAVTNARQYYLRVSRTSDFSVLALERTQNTGTSYVAPAPMDYGVYYWQMRVCTGATLATCTWSNWALGSKFTLTPPLSARPALLSPVNKARLSNLDLDLSWKKVNDDDRYEVQVDNSSRFTSPEETFITPTGVLTYTITSSLTDGVYYWRVRTSNYLTAPGPWSTARSFTLDNVPVSLSPILVAPLDNATIAGTPTFTWKAVTGAVKYQFQLADSMDFSPGNIRITSSDQTTPKYTPLSVIPPGTYYWRAVAKDAAGNAGPWSPHRTITINLPLPTVPVLLTPTSSLTTNIPETVFTWKEVAYADNYEFQLSTSTNFTTPVRTYTGPAATYTANPALADGSYYWRVHAINAKGAGGWSAARLLKVDTVPPDAPILNLPIANGSASATPTFSWLKSTTGATKYQFQYDDDPSFGIPYYMSAVVTTLNHFPKPAMTPDTYYWRVRGWDVAGNESPWSGIRAVTILAAPVLSAPTTGLVTNNPTPTFNWNAVTAANTYEIEISANTTFTDIRQTFIGGVGVRTYTATALPGGKYYWHVRGRNVDDMPGVWSAYRYFTVDLNPPILSSPADNADVFGNPLFKWLASAVAKRYMLQYDADGDFGTGVVTSAELSTTSYSPPPLAVGDWYWRVKAKDALGNWGDYGTAFRVNVLPSVPKMPVPVSPAISAVTNDSTPTFIWNPVVSGNTYDIEIATDAAFTTVIPVSPAPTGLSDTSYTPTTSLPDGLYYWHVRAWNTVPAEGPWSTARSFTVDTTGPDAPMLSSPLDTVSVTGTPAFKWLRSNTATKYRFQYATNSGFTTGVYTSPVELTTTSHTPVTNMPPGTYYWHVQAKDAAGNWGDYNATPFVVTIIPTKPLAPVLTAPANSLVTNVNATPVFTWNPVAYGANYEFQLSNSSTFSPLLSEHSYLGSAPTYTSGDILADGTYYWRVRAINSDAVAGAWSVVRSFRVDTEAPAAPSLNLPAIDASVKGTPTFSWLKSTTGATKYKFEYATDAAFSNVVYITPNFVTTLSVKPPTISLGTYYWHVKAWDAAGNESAWSEHRMVTVTPLTPTGIPTLLGPVNGSIILSNNPTLSWKAVTGAVKYRIQIDGNSTFSSPEFDLKTVSTETEITLAYSPPTNGVYYWRVCKVDQYGGEGAWSAVRRFSYHEVIPLAVTSLSGLSALSNTFDDSTPTLVWNSVAHAFTYQLQVDDDSDFNTPFFDDTAATTSRIVSEPLANGEYYWRVRGINEFGTPGPWSETWVIVIDVPSTP